MATIDVSELTQLGNAFTKSASQARSKAKLVVAKSASDIQASGREKAAVDTGAMQNSIGIDYFVNGLAAEIGPSVYYGIYVEFGTAFQAPQPFMRPAFQQHVPQFEDALIQLGFEILS